MQTTGGTVTTAFLTTDAFSRRKAYWKRSSCSLEQSLAFVGERKKCKRGSFNGVEEKRIAMLDLLVSGEQTK